MRWLYDKKNCPKCGGIKIIKKGFKNNKQHYKCKYCGAVFILKKDLSEDIYKDYVKNKLTLKLLSNKYKKSISTIQRTINKYKPNLSIQTIPLEPVNLVFDAFYLRRGYGWLVFRANGTTIHYTKITYESIDIISSNLRHIDDMGYTYKSITIDGRKGILEYLRVNYPNVPIQYCMFHQKLAIKKCITNNPKTLCGQEIKEISKHLQEYDKDILLGKINLIKDKYKEFLKERSEDRRYKHRLVRRAIKSLTKNAEYLYTYKQYPELKIPTTTNSCDGYFSHIKTKIRVHSGLTKEHKEKLIEFLLKNS